jgi:hypothetical protein
MPWSIVGGIAFMLVGFGGVWVGISTSQLEPFVAHDPDGQLLRKWSQSLMLIGWTTMGLGFVGYGLTMLRYPTTGRDLLVPASAPLVVHVLWVLVLVSVGGGWAMLLVSGLLFNTYRSRRDRRHREKPRDA